MKYIFLGKPDMRFPDLIHGKVYDLKVVSRNYNPVIVRPFLCPYTSWITFSENWRVVSSTVMKKPVIRNKKKITDMERGEKKSFLKKFSLNRDEKEMFKESRRLKIKHPKNFVSHENVREKRITFAYYVFLLALLYAFVILSCVPR